VFEALHGLNTKSRPTLPSKLNSIRHTKISKFDPVRFVWVSSAEQPYILPWLDAHPVSPTAIFLIKNERFYSVFQEDFRLDALNVWLEECLYGINLGRISARLPRVLNTSAWRGDEKEAVVANPPRKEPVHWLFQEETDGEEIPLYDEAIWMEMYDTERQVRDIWGEQMRQKHQPAAVSTTLDSPAVAPNEIPRVAPDQPIPVIDRLLSEDHFRKACGKPPLPPARPDETFVWVFCLIGFLPTEELRTNWEVLSELQANARAQGIYLTAFYVEAGLYKNFESEIQLRRPYPALAGFRWDGKASVVTTSNKLTNRLGAFDLQLTHVFVQTLVNDRSVVNAYDERGTWNASSMQSADTAATNASAP